MSVYTLNLFLLTQGLGGVHLNPLILVAAHEGGLAGADRA